MTKPTPEWLEKWRRIAAIDIQPWRMTRLDEFLTAIHAEVYAKARRETLEEVQGFFRVLTARILLDPHLTMGACENMAGWLAEKLKEADGES